MAESEMNVHDLKALRKTLAGPKPTQEELNLALLKACFWGQLGAARALLEAGADANTVRAAGETKFERATTALLRAVSMARDEDESVILEWLEAFVAHGADLNLAPDGETVLMRACGQLWVKVVGYLLEHGADPSVVRPGKYPTTALYEIMIGSRDDNEKRAEITKQLLASPKPPPLDYLCGGWNRTTLMMAADAGAAEAVRLLLEAGADSALQDEKGETAMSLAAARGHNQVVELLLAHGAASTPEQRSGARFVAAIREKQWETILALQPELAEARRTDPQFHRWVSYAHSQRGDHAAAATVAERGLAFCVDDTLLSRALLAVLTLGDAARGAKLWDEHKGRIDSKSVDPFLIANAMAACFMTKRGAVEMVAEFEPWLGRAGHGEGLSTLELNAACLYAGAGRSDDALRRIHRALAAGKDEKSIRNDSDLTPARQHPAFELILSSCGRGARAAEAWTRPDGKVLELAVDGNTVIETVFTDASGATTESCRKDEIGDNDYAGAILEYVKRREVLGLKGRPVLSPAIEYWRNALDDVLSALAASQAKKRSAKPTGALVIEWDFGDDEIPGARQMWIGATRYDDLPEARKRFQAYCYGDQMFWESCPGCWPAVRSEEIFRAIIDGVRQRPGFTKLRKQPPFFFVLQEHDSGVDYTSEVEG